jgi:hypothetical protein
MVLSLFFEVRNPPLDRGEPVFELRYRIAPENALAGKCLAESLQVRFDFFVIPINLRLNAFLHDLDGIA